MIADPLARRNVAKLAEGIPAHELDAPLEYRGHDLRVTLLFLVRR